MSENEVVRELKIQHWANGTMYAPEASVLDCGSQKRMRCLTCAYREGGVDDIGNRYSGTLMIRRSDTGVVCAHPHWNWTPPAKPKPTCRGICEELAHLDERGRSGSGAWALEIVHRLIPEAREALEAADAKA